MGNKNVSPNARDRRSTPRVSNYFYRATLALNILGWIALVAALVLFHFARPDFISGVQLYWGAEGDTTWSSEYVYAMTIMLLICVAMSLLSLLMRARRTRRRGDRFGINLFVLFGIALISLLTLATTMQSIT